MRTRVVGVTYSNEDGTSRSVIIAGMNESDKIILEREPFNPYDSNAVKVCVIKNGINQQIGYLSKDLAVDVSLKLKKNVRFDVSIVGVGFYNCRPYCEIDVTEVPVARAEESLCEISDPAFTPSRPASKGPIFTPNKPSGQRPVSSPIFTPKPKTEGTIATSSINTTSKQGPNTSNMSRPPLQSHVNKTPVVPIDSSETKPKKSGCFSIIVVIVLIVVLMAMWKDL